jgi:hypothetical protein
MGLLEIYQQPGILLFGFFLLTLWSVVWKGFALWYSAGNKQRKWFIAMLILNTAGLLPIIYLIWARPKAPVKEEPVKKLSRKVIRQTKKVSKKTKKKS